MAITIEEVRKLAVLARIKLSPEEEESLVKDMGNILTYIEQINEVNPSLDSSGKNERVKNVMRHDSDPHESGIHTEVLLAEAPQRKDTYVKVKKIL
jgi:aspartyl-tRNA(Asn)/glutamyl-tRNA(Gln) amidotransferase subunit C